MSYELFFKLMCTRDGDIEPLSIMVPIEASDDKVAIRAANEALRARVTAYFVPWDPALYCMGRTVATADVTDSERTSRAHRLAIVFATKELIPEPR